MSAVALVSDLAMQSQLAGAAERAGVNLAFAGDLEAACAKVESLTPTLVIVDLSEASHDPRTLVPRLKQVLPQAATIVAFGPHVHKERLARALAAGCDLVISRGQFHAEMAEILKRYGGG